MFANITNILENFQVYYCFIVETFLVHNENINKQEKVKISVERFQI